MNLNDINEWKSPEEAERLRKNHKHNWRGRLALAFVFSPVIGIVGAVLFQSGAVFVPIALVSAGVILLFDPNDI